MITMCEVKFVVWYFRMFEQVDMSNNHSEWYKPSFNGQEEEEGSAQLTNWYLIDRLQQSIPHIPVRLLYEKQSEGGGIRRQSQSLPKFADLRVIN